MNANTKKPPNLVGQAIPPKQWPPTIIAK